MRDRKIIWFILALFSLGACDTKAPVESGESHHKIIAFAQHAPPGARPGSCWGKTFVPAVVETVHKKVMIEKARLHEDGSIEKPARYKTETEHHITQPRRENWFEMVCPRQMSGAFIASLQRALSARGNYQGEITGLMDEPTRHAIQDYQKGSGFESGALTMNSAYALGLIAVPRE